MSLLGSIQRLNLVIFVGLLIGGCAMKTTDLRPLSMDEESLARERLQQIMDRPQITALDADIRIRWDVLGNTGGVDAMLQAQKPGLLRLTVVDPLGRSMLILVSDGSSFTMVDNREGVGYEGPVNSAFINRYVPSSILAESLFPVLGGVIYLHGDQVEKIGIDEQRRVWFRYTAGGERGNWYHVLLKDREPVMARRLLVDSDDKVLLDVKYDEYFTIDSRGSLWPGRITVSGSEVRGTFELEVKEVIGSTPVSPKHFQLSLPPQYKQEIVD